LLATLYEVQSFTKAAEKLNVHQSAISHRTKALEEALGMTLFERTTRNFRLTETGEILCKAASSTITNWQQALEKIEQSRSTNVVKLSLPSSLAMKWLIPILPNAQSSDLDIVLAVNEERVDLLEGDAEVAIRFGNGPYPGLHSTLLSKCRIQPTASPAFLRNLSVGNSISEFSNAALLADRRGENDDTDVNWKYYFSKIGVVPENSTAAIRFERSDLMLQAAISGIGIALGRTLLIENDLTAGFLESVGPSVEMRPSYWLVCTPDFASTDRFGRLKDWLIHEIEKTHLVKFDNPAQDEAPQAI